MAPQKSALYSDELAGRIVHGVESGRSVTRLPFAQVQDADFLNQMLYLDTKIFMVSLNLTYNDKMSMASSVEVRVPFLDRELAEFVAWNVPPNLKFTASSGPPPSTFCGVQCRTFCRAKCCSNRRPALRLR